jgi:hypothetical protein
MPAEVKRGAVPVAKGIGRKRRIVPGRARDEELNFFLAMSRESLKVAGRYIDRLLGRP